jgi:hypothetical protein
MSSHRRIPLPLVGAAIALGTGLLFAPQQPAQTQAPAPTGREQGSAAFRRIAEVLQHPRCLNCHQPQSPLQGDAGKAHVPRVVGGPDGHGFTAMRCANCHRDTNNSDSNVPGAPRWHLAPASMSWRGLSVGQLCRALKDRKRNGNRSLQAVVAHMAKDDLVLWGWAPGGSRPPVPIAHQQFVELLETWAASGGACPD